MKSLGTSAGQVCVGLAQHISLHNLSTCRFTLYSVVSKPHLYRAVVWDWLAELAISSNLAQNVCLCPPADV